MSYIGSQPVYQAFVTDQFSGNGSTTAFTMSVAPANTASVLVAVSGVLQDPSTYSVSGTTLTFSAAPPSGTGNISARYLGIPASGVTTTAYRTVTEFTATAGQTTFTPPSYTAGYINVYRNGVRLNSADYTATNGTTVVLTSGATAGDTVTTESFYVSSVVGAMPQTAGIVTQPYIGSGVAGTGPAFRAYLSTNTTISAATYTTIALDTKSYDTATCYSTSTYRFTPNVAGYYLVNLTVSAVASSTQLNPTIAKNGTRVIYGTVTNGISGYAAGGVASDIVYMNGSTDYITGQVYIGTNPTMFSGTDGTVLSASLIRAA